MYINDVQINADLSDILDELQSQLTINCIPLMKKRIDGPDNIQVQCPYHKGGQEHRPSAGIKKSDGTFHCFGCGETHSLQEVIGHCFGHDDVGGMWGWNWILKNFLTVSVENRKDIELNLGRTKKVAEIKYVPESELEKYRYYHPYMYKRGLTDAVIDLFDIGYDKESRCITFPNRDINGNCLFVARRSVDTKFFNYPNGVDKPVYGLYELYNPTAGTLFPSEVIVCESMLDALTCWVFGRFAVALNGLGTDSQFEQLRKLPCRKLILATDMDEAGRKARQRIRSSIKNKLITEFVWDINVAKDINDMSEDYFNQLREVF